MTHPSEDLKEKGKAIVNFVITAQPTSAKDLFLSFKMAQRVIFLQALVQDIHLGDKTFAPVSHAYLTLQFVLPFIYPSI